MAADEPAAQLDDSLRVARVIDKGGYAYLIHPLTDGVPRCPPALLQAWTSWALAQPELGQATVLLAPEAMAFPLVASLSVACGLPYVLARKRPYGLPNESEAASHTGYGSSILHLNDLSPLDRVLVVDDVLSTGGTLTAIVEGLGRLGVPCVGALVFLEKGGRGPALSERFGMPVRSMRRVEVKGGEVKLLP